MKAKYIKLSQYAKQSGVHYNTAMNRFKAGKIKGAIQSETGSIFVPKLRKNSFLLLRIHNGKCSNLFFKN